MVGSIFENIPADYEGVFDLVISTMADVPYSEKQVEKIKKNCNLL